MSTSTFRKHYHNYYYSPQVSKQANFARNNNTSNNNTNIIISSISIGIGIGIGIGISIKKGYSHNKCIAWQALNE